MNRPAGPTPCADPAETVVISPAQPAITTSASGGVIVGGSAYDIALSGGVNPTGTITFHAFGPNDPTCSMAPAFTTQLVVVGNGVYHSPFFEPQQAGTYLWVASYSGDPNNAPATTKCGDAGETLTVLPRQPALSTSASVPGRFSIRNPIQTAGQFDRSVFAGIVHNDDKIHNLLIEDFPPCFFDRLFRVVSGHYDDDLFSFNHSVSVWP